MNTTDIRFTETNSADDSKGQTWGLDGNLFWFMAGGAFAFVIILLLCFSAMRMSFFASLMIAAVPLTLCAHLRLRVPAGQTSGLRRGLPRLLVERLRFWPEPGKATGTSIMFEETPNGYFLNDLIVFNSLTAGRLRLQGLHL